MDKQVYYYIDYSVRMALPTPYHFSEQRVDLEKATE